MATAELGAVLRYIHRRLGPDACQAASDGQLLGRFVARGEEAAFTALLERHGPMVLGVCRRVLAHAQDAEDVFQATFLVLARKAGSVRKQESVSCWLHGTAYRLAVRARAQRALRRAREREALTPRPADPLFAAAWRELLGVLDEEVQRLPEKYRKPLVLCYFEGQTHQEAARQLGCPLGTVRSRVARARDRLRDRLIRRGLTLSAAGLGTVLAANTASAAVPARLVAPTVAAALHFPACGTGPGAASALAEEFTRAALASRLKTAATYVLALAVLGGGAAGLAGRRAPAPAEALAREADALLAAADRPAGPGNKGPAVDGAVDGAGDVLPAGALLRLGTVRLCHGGPVFTVAYSPDGKLLASGSGMDDCTLSVWEAATGREVHRLVGHTDRVFSLAFSPDGKTIASGSYDATVRFWDVATGREIRRCEGHQDHIESVAFSPDGKTLASAGKDAVVRIWDVATGRELRALAGHTELIQSVAFSPDGKTLASSGQDKVIRLWDVAGGRELRQIPTGDTINVGIAFSPDGKTLAGGAVDSVVRLWDPATGQELKALAGHEAEVQFVAFSPDGKTLASSGRDRTIRLWDPATGKPLHTLTGHNERVRSLAFAPDGRTLASASWDQTVRLWDPAAGRELHPAGKSHGWISFIAWAPDGKTIRTGANDRTVRLWDARTGQQLRQFDADQVRGRAVALSPNRRLLAAGTVDGTVVLWDADSGREVRRFGNHEVPVRTVAFSPDGRTLVSGDRNGGIRLWDPATGAQLGSLEGHQSEISTLVYTPDGKTLASGSLDGSLRLWDPAAGRERRAPFAHEYGVESAAFSPDGRLLASGGWGASVRLWDLTTGRGRPALGGHTGPVFRLLFSADGRTLVAADVRAVHLWEVSTGRERAEFVGHRGLVVGLAFDPDGRRLATGSSDGTVLVWDLTARDGARTGGDEAWRDLTGEDAAKAYRALGTLAAEPDEALPRLRRELRPAAAADGKRLARLIAELDSDDFAQREKASAELERLGEAAEGALRQALAGRASAEVRKRVAELLEQADETPPSAERVGQIRMLELLERIGTPESRRLLEALAGGAPEARLTQDARAGLERLRGRTPAEP
jgi:RNA polymerase sigma factor (sigma-70 family)